MIKSELKVVCIWLKEKADTQKLAELCLRFSPQICLRKSQAVFIEIGRCQKLYSEAGFLLRLQVILNRLQIKAQVAIGSDLLEALIMARYQQKQIDLLPLTALVDFVDPFDSDPVLQEYVKKMILNFKDLGANQIGQFKKIPAHEMVTRFGKVGHLALNRVQMKNSIHWPTWRPVEIIFENTEFPYFEYYNCLEPILFELKKQLDSLFSRLWARALKAQSLQITIVCEKTSLNQNPKRIINFNFLYPQGSTKGALNILKEGLSKNFEKNPLRTSIESLETKVTSSVKALQSQKNIFHNREELSERKNSLLSQLHEAHGKNCIYQVELVEDLRPEKSWRKVGAHQIPQKMSDKTLDRIAQRPTCLIRPEKIQVTEDFVAIRKKLYRILRRHPGVEKISGGWIENAKDVENSFDRNYFYFDLEGGRTVYVFQDPKNNYYLHGYYS